VAGHIGLELRRAKSKIISLTTRRYSDFPRPTQTVQSPQGNNLLFQGYPPATLPIQSIRCGLQHIGVRILSRGARRIRTAVRNPNFSTANELRQAIQE
jgi:hypothetical protein